MKNLIAFFILILGVLIVGCGGAGTSSGTTTTTGSTGVGNPSDLKFHFELSVAVPQSPVGQLTPFRASIDSSGNYYIVTGNGGPSYAVYKNGQSIPLPPAAGQSNYQTRQWVDSWAGTTYEYDTPVTGNSVGGNVWQINGASIFANGFSISGAVAPNGVAALVGISNSTEVDLVTATSTTTFSTGVNLGQIDLFSDDQAQAVVTTNNGLLVQYFSKGAGLVPLGLTGNTKFIQPNELSKNGTTVGYIVYGSGSTWDAASWDSKGTLTVLPRLVSSDTQTKASGLSEDDVTYIIVGDNGAKGLIWVAGKVYDATKVVTNLPSGVIVTTNLAIDPSGKWVLAQLSTGNYAVLGVVSNP